MKNRIIVIEGTDCSGKETQSKLLEKRLIEQGKKVITLSFPMYDTPTGKIIGECYLGRGKDSGIFPEGAVNLDPKIACLYYAADRKYNIDIVNKYLQEGYIVILDRYISSNMAYQGSKIKDKDERFYMYQWIDKLEYWLLDLPKPDITIFLHVPTEYSRILLENRTINDENEKDENYLKLSEQAYIELSELYNWKTIECVEDGKLRSIEEINDDILKALT